MVLNEHEGLINELREYREGAAKGGGDARIDAQHAILSVMRRF